MPKELRAVVYRRGDWWIAQCLEHDVTTAAKDLDDLHHELDRVIVGHFLIASKTGSEPFAGLSRAPERFFQMWEEARTSVEPVDVSQDLPTLPSDAPSPPHLARRLHA